MSMSSNEIEKLVKDLIPDAVVEIADLKGDGSHWALMVSSSQFAGKTRIAQHKMVYNALKGKVGEELHALQLKTKIL